MTLALELRVIARSGVGISASISSQCIWFGRQSLYIQVVWPYRSIHTVSVTNIPLECLNWVCARELRINSILYSDQHNNVPHNCTIYGWHIGIGWYLLISKTDTSVLILHSSPKESYWSWVALYKSGVRYWPIYRSWHINIGIGEIPLICQP